jgi:hypothetical protein
MGRSHYKIYNTEVPHFLTMTVVDWLPIFANREIADIIFDSLRYLQEEKKAKLYAYVIMENVSKYALLVSCCSCIFSIEVSFGLMRCQFPYASSHSYTSIQSETSFLIYRQV